MVDMQVPSLNKGKVAAASSPDTLFGPVSATTHVHYDGGHALVQLRFVNALALKLRRDQYVALLALTETLARSEARHRNRSHLRPTLHLCREAGAARAWWGYAGRATLAEVRARAMATSWRHLLERHTARSTYRAAYATALRKRALASREDLAATLDLADLLARGAGVRAERAAGGVAAREGCAARGDAPCTPCSPACRVWVRSWSTGPASA